MLRRLPYFCANYPLHLSAITVQCDAMNVAECIIAKFGGVRKAAKKGKWAPSTVQSWKDAGYIPARRQPEVLEAGRDLPDPVTPADFFGEAA